MTPLRTAFFGLLIGFSAALIPSCGPTRCDSTSCASGCCDGAGLCQAGTESAACGTGGSVCRSCSNAQLCSAGACIVADAGLPFDAGMRCQAGTVDCFDQSSTNLGFKTAIPPDSGITNTPSNGTFETVVDARAGGLMFNKAYTYARFTANGLEQVPLTDEESLNSTEWDIAFRRFVIRLNSGVSGPSCVTVARTAPDTLFANATVDATLSFRTESYFTATCDFVPDGSGLDSAPGTALSSYWRYAILLPDGGLQPSGCLSMTKNVYIVKLADGRHVKLEVLEYYGAPNAQATCDSTGSVPMPSDSAKIKVRWAFL